MFPVFNFVRRCFTDASPGFGYRRLGGKIIVFSLILFLSLPFSVYGEEGGKSGSLSIDEFRNRVREWVELRKELAAEKREWEKQDDLLESEKTVLSKRKRSLEEEIAEEDAAVSELTEERRALKNKKQDLQALLSELSEVLADREDLLLQYRESLPEFLRRQLSEDFTKLRSYAGSAEKENAVGDRLNLVLSIIREIQQAGNSIHCENVIVSTGSEKERELTALYIGLAKAFAVSSDGEFCAVGKPDESGWHWQRAPELASVVKRSIAIYRENADIDLVELPLEVEEAELN